MSPKRLIIMAAVVMALMMPIALVGGIVMMAGTTMSLCPSGSEEVVGTPGKASPDLGLVEAIKAATNGDGRLAAAMLFGTYMESRWNPSATSHDGAFGAYQIQSPGVVHPKVTVAQALNPAFATNYMLSAYQGALRVIDPLLWQSNPEQAMMHVAYGAERPLYNYNDHRAQGPSVVREAYQATLKVLGEIGLTLTGPVVGTVIKATTDVASTVLSACGQYSSVGVASAPTVQSVLKIAESQLGVPYVFGGGTLNGPSGSSLAPGIGFDCASYVRFVFHKSGIELPAGSIAQWRATVNQRVPAGQEQPGDLVFFGGYTGKANGPGHVGIVVDPAKKLMYNEPRTGDVARISSYDWGDDVMGFTRPYPSEG